MAKPQKSIGSTLPQSNEISGQDLVQEIVTSVWINELEMGLKMYDIMSLMKHGSTEGACAQIRNESFTFDKDTAKVRVLKNPRQRLKRVCCVNSHDKESN